MKKIGRVVALMLVIAIGITPFAMAYPYEYWRKYYTDQQYTTLNGVHIVDCDGRHWFWGTLSGYLVEEWYDCPY